MDGGYSIRILMLGVGILMLVVLIMSEVALVTERYGTAETQSQVTAKKATKVVVTTQDVKEMRNLLTVSNLLVALLSVLAVSNGVALFHVCRSLRKFQNSKEFFQENTRKG